MGCCLRDTFILQDEGDGKWERQGESEEITPFSLHYYKSKEGVRGKEGGKRQTKATCMTVCETYI